MLVVAKAFERVKQIAVSNNLVRTLFNIGNGLEPNESFLTLDRDKLYRDKLNSTIEELRQVQNELNLIDFRFSREFSEKLQTDVLLKFLGEFGDAFNTSLSHQSALSTYIAYLEECVHTPREEMTGRLDIMTLHPEAEVGQHSGVEIRSYFVVHNGNDGIRASSQEYEHKFLEEASEHSQLFLSDIRLLTSFSIVLIALVSLALAIGIGRIERKKL